MKYIKDYKLFELLSSNEDEIRDSFLPITDKGYKIDISERNSLDSKYKYIDININVESSEELIDIKNDLEFPISYMENNGFKITQIFIKYFSESFSATGLAKISSGNLFYHSLNDLYSKFEKEILERRIDIGSLCLIFDNSI